ncbi:MAG: PEP-CTERM sorting domain-containing protein, partial [Planctomycetales bacterium]|nr:PEP-CTERM sorting domain-containing protein [Planctomycetales bacterium]
DSSDFVAAFSAGGYENGPRAAVSAVPEPATMTLGLIGLGWMFGGMRRRRTA